MAASAMTDSTRTGSSRFPMPGAALPRGDTHYSHTRAHGGLGNFNHCKFHHAWAQAN